MAEKTIIGAAAGPGLAPSLGHREAMILAATEFDRIVAQLSALAPADWARPTVCELWDVRGMAAHVLGMAEAQASFRQFAHDFRAAGKIGEGPQLVKHHHSPEHLASPQHQLEGVLLALLPIGFVFTLAETPAVNGQRHQAFFRADRRVSRLHACATQQLFFPQVVLARVPMHKKDSGCPRLSAVRNEQHRWNRFDPIKVENQPLECVPIMFLRSHQARRCGLVVPGQIAE